MSGKSKPIISESPITRQETGGQASHQSARSDLRATLRDAIAQLEEAHVPSAPFAAELLLVHTLGRDRVWIYAHTEHELTVAEHEQFFSLVARRSSGVPTQHLTGHQEFWSLDFEVTPDVLIPRPETEHVIEVTLRRLGISADTAGSPIRQNEFRIADVGTGSGCIAIALAHELPAARIFATDISKAALEVARRNAARHEVTSRIEFIECNLLDVLLHESRNTNYDSRFYDLVVSNPPYIARLDAATLAREVREHEPETALYGGETGVELYASLIAQAAQLLKPGGSIVLELGHDSAAHVSKLLATQQWTSVAFTKDLAGIVRVASAQRSDG